MVPGPTLIDHERVRGLGAAPHEVAAIYRIGAGGAVPLGVPTPKASDG